MPVPTTPRPVTRRRLLKDEAHDAIRDAILDGTFAPGERLDDQALTQWLGVSRSPIREALNLLAAEGFVEIHAQSRTSVVSPDPSRIEDEAQAIGVLMGGTIRLVVPTLTEATRSAAIALVDVGLDAIEQRDLRRYLRVMGSDFFDYLIELCPNPVVAGIASGTVPSLAFRIRIADTMRTPNWKLLEHGWGQVREALRSGDVSAAELAFAEIHRLPVSDTHWAPAEWAVGVR